MTINRTTVNEGLRSILNNTKGLAKLVRPRTTLNTFVVLLNDKYGANYSLGEVRGWMQEIFRWRIQRD